MLTASFPRSVFNDYFRALRDLGYEEGRNLVVDFKFGQGRADLLPAVASELVAANPHVLVGPTDVDIAALRLATNKTPVVMLYTSEPVATGLIASLARPGGNITGIHLQFEVRRDVVQAAGA